MTQETEMRKSLKATLLNILAMPALNKLAWYSVLLAQAMPTTSEYGEGGIGWHTLTLPVDTLAEVHLLNQIQGYLHTVDCWWNGDGHLLTIADLAEQT
jgi:hypothetical protein